MNKITQEDNMQEDLGEKLVPPVVDKPGECELSSQPFSNSSLDSRDSMDGQDNQAIVQEMRSQENLESSQHTQSEANKEDHIDLHLSFPRKLWLVAENPAIKSVTWNEEGDHVIIHAEHFQEEVLDLEGTDKIFHASTLKSFIRLLNLHEFIKIRPNNTTLQAKEQGKVMIYHHRSFRRDNPTIVKNICIRRNTRHTDPQETYKTSPKKEVKEEAQTSDVQQDPQNDECLNDPGSRRVKPLCFPGFPLRNTSPWEANNYSGEGTSGNNVFQPLPDYDNEGHSISQAVPDIQYLMDLYNICCSFLLSSLLFLAPDEPREDDEDHEDED
ncbi:heat shock transcription factor, X-linked member 3-like [Thomomys bottae]